MDIRICRVPSIDSYFTIIYPTYASVYMRLRIGYNNKVNLGGLLNYYLEEVPVFIISPSPGGRLSHYS